MMFKKGLFMFLCILFSVFLYSCAGNSVKNGGRAHSTLEIAASLRMPTATVNGPVTLQWSDDSLKAKGRARAGKPEGVWKLFYKGTGGKTRMAEGPFRGGFLNGEWTVFTKDGKKAEKRTFSHGILHGRRMIFYPSGIGKVEEYYIRGVKNNKYMEYFPDGKMKENSYFQNGLLNGASSIYHQNGKIKESGRYSRGKREGRWDFFNSAGVLELRGYYKMGKKSGTWTYYDKERRKVNEKKYS